MSRAYNARRKARRQAQAATERTGSRRPEFLRRRFTALVPVFLIAAIVAVVGVLGFGASDGVSKKQIEKEVTALLDGIPQNGATLGSPRAPVTLRLYGDLECPSVKLYVEKYLPSLIDTWVRTGAVKLEYRSLATDTSNEEIFFEQEIAALAAGKQERMWNYVLTFVLQQGEVRTDYVTEQFLVDIASQVPGLKTAEWRRDREEPLLSKRVALGVYSGHSSGFRGTPSFQIGFTSGTVDQSSGFSNKASLLRKIKFSVDEDLRSLRQESIRDVTTLRTINPGIGGG